MSVYRPACMGIPPPPLGQDTPLWWCPAWRAGANRAEVDPYAVLLVWWDETLDRAQCPAGLNM